MWHGLRVNKGVREGHGQKHVKFEMEGRNRERGTRGVADEFLGCTTSGLGPKCLWGSCGFSANKSSAHI